MPDAILKGEIVDEATEVAEATLIKQKVMGAECKKSDESVKEMIKYTQSNMGSDPMFVAGNSRFKDKVGGGGGCLVM